MNRCDLKDLLYAVVLTMMLVLCGIIDVNLIAAYLVKGYDWIALNWIPRGTEPAAFTIIVLLHVLPIYLGVKLTKKRR